MRIAALPFLLLPVVACHAATSAPLATPAAPPAQVTQNSTTTEIRLADDNSPTTALVAAPVEDVWKAVISTFQGFGFEVNQLDTNRHVIGTQGHKVRRTLNGLRLSTLFDCGTDLSGVVADKDQIRINVQIGVAAAGTNESTVATRVTATAYPVEGTSTDPMRCGSKGRLEKRILEEVRARSGT